MNKDELLTEVKFDDKGLITAVLQDFNTGEVLMVGFMNQEALKKTIETDEAWFFSRSRQELWHKGETSGHLQKIKEIKLDCDGDALLLKVESVGGQVCHTGKRSCFFRSVGVQEDVTPVAKKEFQLINELYQLILDRKVNPKEGSYTCYLWEQGQDKMLKKVGEEAAEVIIGSKNNCQDEVVYETADLIFHLLVLLAWHGIKPAEIIRELEKRR
ncbi:MAG TPA: bifunctional phosphoribosyl-AMP cyclohydrolase/phosphoribosyl-ATP pyrophosphatase [Firmicutes bacterium]|jgi:phosphoribosyl-ATP pyrophosphohydrolase/phosphoribosyl-AMP cyclohydrolase|nr:bifunctional phosphoribosyl-AMP cyclohydrolase/phosphoribosyl-ATP pyrophosphatase [Bacillota bacterium]